MLQRSTIYSDYNHLPGTYMEQFCMKLTGGESNEFGETTTYRTCTTWFRQAIDHCSEIVLKGPALGSASQIWDKIVSVKNIIFPERQTFLLNKRIPISIHPNRLSPADCSQLLLDVVNDYIIRIPHYSAVMTVNSYLWNIFCNMLGVMAILSGVIFTMLAYNKYSKRNSISTANNKYQKKEQNLIEMKEDVLLRKNVRRLSFERRHLKLLPIDMCPTIVIQVNSTMFAKEMSEVSALLVKHDPNAAESQHKKTLRKLTKFIGNEEHKLGILFVLNIDDDQIEDQITDDKQYVDPSLVPCIKPATTDGERRKISTGIKLPSSRLSEIPVKRNPKKIQK